jgi:opacity protein-like surface antigen
MKNLLLAIAIAVMLTSCAGSYDVTSTIMDIVSPEYYFR